MSRDFPIHFNIVDYQNSIIGWFRSNGRHDLPWQGKFNPYYVWISEVMLQQTQVKTVIPYFLKFIEKFPNLESLAIADRDQVMLFWEGLGYYARAINLQRSALIIKSRYRNIFPDKYEDLISLPGIGRSTANAILSICFNKSAPILDANVRRVFSRVFMLDYSRSNINLENSLWNIANQLMPSSFTQEYTQSQMDLGALCCLKKEPNCIACPIKKFCLANSKGEQDNYPKKNKLKKKITKNKTYFIYFCNNKVYLEKSFGRVIWQGLYMFPEVDLELDIEKITLVSKQKHNFSHYTLYYGIQIYFLKKNHDSDQIKNRLILKTSKKVSSLWVDLGMLDNYPMPTMIKKILKKELLG